MSLVLLFFRQPAAQDVPPENRPPLVWFPSGAEIRRPQYDVAQQPSYASPIVPERTSPLTDVQWPDFARRPALLVASQLTLAPRPEQLVVAPDVIFPDAVRRPLFPTPEQVAFVTSPAPERNAPVFDAEWADFARRPFFVTASQLVAAPRPEQLIVAPDAVFPETVRRGAYATALRLAFTTEPSTPPATSSAPTVGYVEFPAFVLGRKFGVSLQLAVTEETPAPERQTPLADVEWPDRPVRPAYAPPQQLAFAGPGFAPTPYLNATGLGIYPDSVVRPKYGAAQQQAYGDDTSTVFVTQFIQQVSLGWHADRVVRPAYPVAQQLPEVEPRIERTSPLEAVDFPARITRPFVPVFVQPFASAANLRPERTVVAFDVLFPETVRRPMFPATEQLAATELPPAPERTIDSFDVWYPASVRRPVLLTALQLAVTEETPSPVALLAPKPFAVEFPASVRKPALHASQHLDSAMPWARAVQAAVPVPYSDAEYPGYIWRRWSPANIPALSSGISVFFVASAPNGRAVTGFPTNGTGIEERSARGTAGVPTAHPSVRVRVANGAIVVRTSTSRVRE